MHIQPHWTCWQNIYSIEFCFVNSKSISPAKIHLCIYGCIHRDTCVCVCSPRARHVISQIAHYSSRMVTMTSLSLYIRRLHISLSVIIRSYALSYALLFTRRTLSNDFIANLVISAASLSEIFIIIVFCL